MDAFASTHNALFPDFWTVDDDALSKSWSQGSPLWANPPFSLLPTVLAKLEKEGGNVILLCPEWSPAAQTLLSLARARIVLPLLPLYRVRGATILPPPNMGAVGGPACNRGDSGVFGHHGPTPDFSGNTLRVGGRTPAS